MNGEMYGGVRRCDILENNFGGKGGDGMCPYADDVGSNKQWNEGRMWDGGGSMGWKWNRRRIMTASYGSGVFVLRNYFGKLGISTFCDIGFVHDSVQLSTTFVCQQVYTVTSGSNPCCTRNADECGPPSGAPSGVRGFRARIQTSEGCERDDSMKDDNMDSSRD